jgi:putative redox protein
MTNQPTIAIVKETRESAFAVEIAVSGYHINGDEPVDAGGGSLGPAPYDLLTAALGECTAMTVRWYALQQQWPLEKVMVTITHHKEGKQDVFTKEVTLVGEALTEAQSQKLVEIAAKCPVQRTLEGTPSIETR